LPSFASYLFDFSSRELTPHLAEDVLASFGAGLAGLGAYAAMLVVISVPRALLTAAPARLSTGFNDATRDLGLEGSLPGKDLSGRHADIGAVEVEAHAAPQVRDHVFGETGVGTRGAGLDTVEAGIDTALERVAVERRRLRMRPQHFSYMRHFHSSIVCLLSKSGGGDTRAGLTGEAAGEHPKLGDNRENDCCLFADEEDPRAVTAPHRHVLAVSSGRVGANKHE
jgi:hypothetical protein